MNKELTTKNFWFHAGYSFKRFSLNITIHQNGMELDFIFFWVGVEW